ncbi:two-partner secretion domain-containing protein [Rhodopirellula sp. P2]|uniref:two-partner secretion domain-containing protein n=1 Tax=Rhodopirellula sp. P2 TaxID=2127060 RepID=UPI002367833E|nr:filamentous hemagglutinin N-terminal domain-containing protein [Rhodopirellula sp. P2]WDQ14956.1 filamentous hemagglutinin N-terminal domain-containing protein [Rhodopirellula sp. P2]
MTKKTDRRSNGQHNGGSGVRLTRTSVVRKRLLLAAILAGCSMPGALFAQAPVGGNIVAGAGTIDHSVSNLTNITTSTDRAVINWDDFSVGSGHTVNFDQLSSNSAVLNRVIGSAPQSLINGAITSNGNVFVSNASGVVIGSTGVINTNGFTATTLDITNDRFMSGDLSFGGNSNAAVINNGLISTGDGGANLIASQVFNNGTIESTGNINLATGGQLKMAGGRYIQADLETISSGISKGSSLIQNSGTIRAIGGLNVGGEVYLVNPNGNIVNDATIIAALSNPDGTQSGGRVEMIASADASLKNASIDVSGKVGGRVVVTGESVEMTSSKVDASGELGGGEVRVGGGWKGQDATVANATTTNISADSQISVDATVDGDAGSVVVWADKATDFAGQINARALGDGDGGQAEVSGKQELVFSGNADMRASRLDGEHGTLLLDPASFTLDSSNQDAIRAQWGSGNLVIEAEETIDIEVDLFPTLSSGGDEKGYNDGSKTTLTLREQTGGDGAVDITIAAEMRDSRQGSAAVEINAGTGSVTVTEDGKISSNLGGNSDVIVSANSFDVAGSVWINKLVATGNESVGVGSATTGTMNLSDETMSNIGTLEIQGSDFDVDMGGPASSYSTLKLVGETVNIDRFEGYSLNIESNDLTITGPVTGGGSFRFIGQANQSIGLGSGSGDLQFSKAILAGITGFYSFEMGHNTDSGSDISIVDAGLDFNTVTLRGSSIDIDRLSIGTNLYMYTDSLNVQNALTKTADTGTLNLTSMTNNRSVGLGDGTAGLLQVSADEFAHLGRYSYLEVNVGFGDVTVAMDFTGNYDNRIEVDNANGLIHLNGVSVDSSLFQLISNDLQVSDAVTGDIDNTALALYAGVSRMAVGSAASGDWTLDNTEFAFLSNFQKLTLHNTQTNGMLDVVGFEIGNELDFSSITPGEVNFLSDSMRLSDVSVPKALNISVYSGLAFDGGVTTDDPTSSLTITAGRASFGSGGSSTIGLGTGTTGDVHLDDDEIARITQFDTVHATHIYSSSPGTTQVNATFDKNLTLSGGQQTTIESLTMTGGSDLDVSTHNKWAGNDSPGADKIVVGDITSDGDITIDSSRVEVNGDAHTVNGDVRVEAELATIGNGTQTSHVSIGSANGTTTVETDELNINASGTAGAQIGYAFTGTEVTAAAGDIVVETTGDVNLTGQGSHFASIGHGDLLGGDDTGKTVSGDVTLSGGKNVTIQKGHVGHLVDGTGTYGSGSTTVFAGRQDFTDENEHREVGDSHQPYSLDIDGQSVLVSAAFADEGKLSLFAPALSSYNLDPSALLNGGNATGDPPTNYAGPSDPDNDFFGEYLGDAAHNWSLFSAPIGLEIQILDATSVYGDVILSPATVDMLTDASVLFGSTTVEDLGLQVDYDGIDHETNAGTYVLQVDSDALKNGYFIRKLYRNGETFGTGPGTLITNYGRHIITPADLSIVVNHQTKTYGDLLTLAGNEFVATGLKNSQVIENLVLVSGGTAESATVLGGPYSITGSSPTGTGFLTSNYGISYTAGALTVSPAPLDLILLSDSKLLGTEGVTETTQFIANGLKHLDGIEHVAVVSSGIPTTAALGAYDLEIDAPFGVHFDASNYAIHSTDATLTVFSKNGETSHDVWTRSQLATSTLPMNLNGGGGGMSSSQTGRATVEITAPGQDGELSGHDAGQPDLDDTVMPSEPTSDGSGVELSVSSFQVDHFSGNTRI